MDFQVLPQIICTKKKKNYLYSLIPCQGVVARDLHACFLLALLGITMVMTSCFLERCCSYRTAGTSPPTTVRGWVPIPVRFKVRAIHKASWGGLKWIPGIQFLCSEVGSSLCPVQKMHRLLWGLGIGGSHSPFCLASTPALLPN